MIKKRAVMISISVLFSLLFSIYGLVSGAEKKGVTLTTADLKQDYEILGLVSYRTGELNPKKINDELTKQAESMGADYVIGITYYNNAGYLYGSGTAVKLIKKDKKN
ncbi:MAG: hypothetical protein KKI13_04655 [Candidatus Omnitrophica bacterium]|nr:hypothetical protein [Candidatus Omnitrophota bacterium]MCG2705063.1 hypothetical protein [Candidatus Omnitrophota bacterium]